VGVLRLEPRAGDPLEVEDAVRPEVKGGFAAFDGEGFQGFSWGRDAG
jgi:hypothetical protein